jgi:DNA-binding CsgD family transcriptional regulator
MTPREREVALLVERDLSNDEIACKLGIRLGTVKIHVHTSWKNAG